MEMVGCAVLVGVVLGCTDKVGAAVTVGTEDGFCEGILEREG